MQRSDETHASLGSNVLVCGAVLVMTRFHNAFSLGLIWQLWQYLRVLVHLTPSHAYHTDINAT